MIIEKREDFDNLEVLIQSDGWKLFQRYIEEVAQGCLSQALSNELDERIQIKNLAKYKVLKEIIQGVYADYKHNYDKYKGE